MPYRMIVRRSASGEIREQRQIAEVKPRGLEALSYRELQARAIELGISGKQTAEALREAITNAE